MTRRKKLTKNELRALQWEAWCKSRPPNVARVARKLQPWHDYILTIAGAPGQVCQIVSFDEHEGDRVTLTVRIRDSNGENYGVFGVPPDQLTRAVEN